jgi:hypothetical protein
MSVLASDAAATSLPFGDNTSKPGSTLSSDSKTGSTAGDAFAADTAPHKTFRQNLLRMLLLLLMACAALQRPLLPSLMLQMLYDQWSGAFKWVPLGRNV